MKQGTTKNPQRQPWIDMLENAISLVQMMGEEAQTKGLLQVLKKIALYLLQHQLLLGSPPGDTLSAPPGTPNRVWRPSGVAQGPSSSLPPLSRSMLQ